MRSGLILFLRCRSVVVSKFKINSEFLIIIIGAIFDIIFIEEIKAYSQRLPSLKLTMYRNDDDKKKKTM